MTLCHLTISKLIFFLGARGGIVRLQFAYQFNLTELNENGIIQYKSPNGYGQTENIPTYERLSGIDCGGLAQHAMKQKFFDTGIDFVKEGMRLKNSKKNEGIWKMYPAHTRIGDQNYEYFGRSKPPPPGPSKKLPKS